MLYLHFESPMFTYSSMITEIAVCTDITSRKISKKWFIYLFGSVVLRIKCTILIPSLSEILIRTNEIFGEFFHYSVYLPIFYTAHWQTSVMCACIFIFSKSHRKSRLNNRSMFNLDYYKLQSQFQSELSIGDVKRQIDFSKVGIFFKIILTYWFQVIYFMFWKFYLIMLVLKCFAFTTSNTNF